MKKDRAWRAAVIAAACMITGSIMLARHQPAMAQTGAAGGSLSRVAVIDIDGVLSQLQERTDSEAELTAYGTELKTKLNELNQRYEQKKQDLEVLRRGTPQYKDALVEVVRLQETIDFELQLSETLMAEREKEIVIDLYNKIETAAASYAGANGIDLVLVDDRNPPMTPGMSVTNFRQRLTNRKVLFANSGADITDEVATMMNNNFMAQNATP